MSVSETDALKDDDLTRFPGPAQVSGLVGIFSADVQVTGDASGGSLTASLSIGHNLHGFPAGYVLTALSVLAAGDPGNVGITLLGANNRYGGPDLVFGFDPVVQNTQFVAPEYVLPRWLHVPVRSGGIAVQATFDTNLDTVVFHLHVYGVVYSMNALAKSGRYEELVTRL